MVRTRTSKEMMKRKFSFLLLGALPEVEAWDKVEVRVGGILQHLWKENYE